MKLLLSLLIILSVVNHFNCLYQGTAVSQSNARFVASVRIRGHDSPFGNGFLCAAIVISNWNVLTAASCVIGRSANDLQVAMGATELTRRNLVINVQRISVHQNFTLQSSQVNNIAILRLSRNIRHKNRKRYNRNRNSQVQQIALSNSPPLQTCQFLAWGDGNSLLQANLPIWQENVCGNFTNGIFCAGNINNGPAVCRRNLGGPFVCNNQLVDLQLKIQDAGRLERLGIFIL